MTLTPVDRRVREEIARHGPLPWSAVVEAALYDDEAGFYTTAGQAGRRGDFVTSPEVGALFGSVVARALDDRWVAMGRPEVFVVVEAGAGPGTLARTILAAAPACATALRYVLVERSAAQRGLHRERLPLEDPAHAFASVAEDPDDDEVVVPPPPGPMVVSLAELPRTPGPCVVLANELLDNLPFDLIERTADGWAEVRVGVEGDGLVEVLVPGASDPGVPADPGARVPVQRAAAAWVAEARALAGPDGCVVAFDYGAPLAELAARPWTEWVRTYRGQQRGGPPLEALGTQDVTVEVATDGLGSRPDADRSQADWLRAHGIDTLVEEGRRIWAERAHLGDLAAVRARSRVHEAEALLDPTGLGAFRVLEWSGT